MKRSIILFLIILISFACSDKSNPIKQQPLTENVSSCSYAGTEVVFADSCSYDFIVSFIPKIDSAEVIHKNLGATYYLNAELEDFNYWTDYFKNDKTIQHISSYSKSDTLILIIETSGEKTKEEEDLRFQSIDNLYLIKVKNIQKRVSLFITGKNIGTVEQKLKEYLFILNVASVMICQGG